MISKSRIHDVHGIEQGEYLMLLALTADEYILTIVEPEDYGDSRQAASMALTREQLWGLVGSALGVLAETQDDPSEEVSHNG